MGAAELVITVGAKRLADNERYSTWEETHDYRPLIDFCSHYDCKTEDVYFLGVHKMVTQQLITEFEQLPNPAFTEEHSQLSADALVLLNGVAQQVPSSRLYKNLLRLRLSFELEQGQVGDRLRTTLNSFISTSGIEEVGDTSHLTFFEMLGNWSLGDYGKEGTLSWSWQFLTEVLGLPKERFSGSVFGRGRQVPRDQTSFGIWRKLGVPDNRIHFYGRSENLWGPPGRQGPCGPDSEFFLLDR